MNEFDQFVKHTLKVKYYARYTDDFVIIAKEHSYLEMLLPIIRKFLSEKLLLSLHPDKIMITNCIRGVDFLGYVAFPHHALVRAKTRKRIFKKLKEKVGDYKQGLITENTLQQTLQSYLGVFSHANAHELCEQLKNQFWFWLSE